MPPARRRSASVQSVSTHPRSRAPSPAVSHDMRYNPYARLSPAPLEVLSVQVAELLANSRQTRDAVAELRRDVEQFKMEVLEEIEEVASEVKELESDDLLKDLTEEVAANESSIEDVKGNIADMRDDVARAFALLFAITMALHKVGLHEAIEIFRKCLPVDIIDA